MKLRNFRSVVTVAISDEHNTPRPPAPLAQCRTVPPRKCPPQRISVRSGMSFRVSPFHNWIAGSGRHSRGGTLLGVYWVPQAVQINASISLLREHAVYANELYAIPLARGYHYK